MCWKIFKQKFKVWKSFKFIDEFSLAPSFFEVADNGWVFAKKAPIH